MADRSQIGRRSVADRSQIGRKSVADWSQIGRCVAIAAARHDHPATFLCSHAGFTLSFPEALLQCEHLSVAIVAVRRCSRTCTLPFEASAAARHACPATCRSTLANLTSCCSETVALCDVRTDGIVAMRHCSATCALPFEASAAARQDHPATFLSSRAGFTLSCPETLLQCEHRSEAIVALRHWSRTRALPFEASVAARHAYPVTFCSTLANLTLSCSETVANCELRTVAIVAMRRCLATCALPFEASAAARHAYPATFRTTLANLTLSCSETVAQCELRTEAIVAMRRCSATCALPFEASAGARQGHPAAFLSSHAGFTLSCPETLLQCEHRSEAIVALRRCSRTCALPFEASAASRHAYPATFCFTQANLTLSCSETVAQCEHRTEAVVAMRRSSSTCALPF